MRINHYTADACTGPCVDGSIQEHLKAFEKCFKLISGMLRSSLFCEACGILRVQSIMGKQAKKMCLMSAVLQKYSVNFHAPA